VEAVAASGLRIKTATAEHVVHPSASTSLGRGDGDGVECVLVAVKAHAVANSVATLAGVVPADTPLVCLENGVSSEDAFAARFARVYGGVVRMTCTMVQPGHVTVKAPGRVVIGLHPRGVDPFAQTLAETFQAAGFDASASREITADKWLKMAVNVQSVFHAVIDERDHESDLFLELKAGILDETRRVLKAARIRAKSCDGRDPSIEDMLAELKRPRAHRTTHGVKVHNSVWQDLYLKRRHLEAEFIHGPVIALGKKHGVATPYNRAALAIVERVHHEAGGPETMRVSDVAAAVEREMGAK
jgi:2-dehydropantoate 2-reductase